VTSAGYVGKGAPDANDEAALSTTYGGTLAIVAKGATQTGTTDQTAIDIAAFANALNLTASTKGSVTNGVTTYSDTNVVLTGDVKTATIVVNNSVDNSKLTAGNKTATVTLAPTDAQVDAANGLLSFANLGNLASVIASGTGVVVINNTDTRPGTGGTTVGTKLVSVDASGLVGTDLTPGATLGFATAGLNMTFGLSVEAVKLGSALDTLKFSKADVGLNTVASSTVAKMDSITGFTLVAKADGSLWTEKSDSFVTTGANASKITGTYVAKTGSSVSGTLDAALTAVGLMAADNVVFANGGNTYIYSDIGSNGSGEDDILIELIGLVDLDLLIADLA